MGLVAIVSRGLERLLEGAVALLMVSLTLVVVLAVVYRKLGASFVWYDEVASVMLAWLTYYGAALAALKRAHIGFEGFLLALPTPLRILGIIFAEIAIFSFFLVLAWTGWRVLQVLEGVSLVSLTWVPVQLTQSVIPIGAVLFMLAEALSLPAYWRRMRLGLVAHEDISHDAGAAVATAREGRQ